MSSSFTKSKNFSLILSYANPTVESFFFFFFAILDNVPHYQRTCDPCSYLILELFVFLFPEYKIIDKIGEGSFSEVVKCQDRETGELYAAKRLKKTFQT